jgi:hypothetical protein
MTRSSPAVIIAWSMMISATAGLLLATKIKLEKMRLRMDVIYSRILATLIVARQLSTSDE